MAVLRTDILDDDDQDDLHPAVHNALHTAYNAEHLGRFNAAEMAGSTGTSDQIIAAAEEANAAGGGLVVIPGGVWTIGDSIPIYDFVHFVGYGLKATELKMEAGANVDCFRDPDFAANTGGESGLGPKKFSIKDMTLNGNCLDGPVTGVGTKHNTAGFGIRFFGFDYELEHLEVWNFAEKGIHSEWSEYDQTYSNYYWTHNYEYGQMEGRMFDVQVHHNLTGGLVMNGPHDSKIIRVRAYKNGPAYDALALSDTAGIEIGKGDRSRAQHDQATATLCFQCHSWGINQGYAWVLGSSHTDLIDCQGEGGVKAQVWALRSSQTIIGGRYFRGDNRASDIALKVGDNSRLYDSGLNLVVTQFTKGRIHFDRDSGGSQYKVGAYNAYSTYASTLTSSFTIPTSGAATMNVVTTEGMPSMGQVRIGSGDVFVNYAGVTATTFTFCTPDTASGTTGGATYPSGTAIVASAADTTAPQYAVTGTQSIINPNRLDMLVQGGGTLGPAAQTDLAEIAASKKDVRQMFRGAVPPSGAIAESIPRWGLNNDLVIWTSARMSLMSCGMVAAQTPISSIKMLAGATAATGPMTHQWFALYRLNGSTLELLAVTTDDTSTAWPVSASGSPGTAGTKTLNIEKTMSGGALITGSAWSSLVDTHVYAGAVVVNSSGVPPSVYTTGLQTGATAMTPFYCALGPSTVLSTPSTAPLTINTSAITANSRAWYVALS